MRSSVKNGGERQKEKTLKNQGFRKMEKENTLYFFEN